MPQASPATTAPTVSPMEMPSATPAVTETPAAVPTPTETPAPTVAPTAAPTVTPTPTPLPSPTATPVNPYKYVVDPPLDPNAAPGSPQISRIEINDKVVHVGGQIAIRVTTTPNVSTVYIEVEGRTINIPKAQDGLFAGIQQIPGFIPPWFLKTYQVTFNAVTPDGKRTSATIPIALAY